MGDYQILMQFDIEADRETIHRALATGSGLAGWWSARAEGPDDRTDGEIRVWFPDVPEPFQLRVLRSDAERVEWAVGGFPPPWAGTSIRWDMAANPDGRGTRLLFGHRAFDADNPIIPVVTPVWAQIVLRLKSYVETGTPAPFFPG